MLMIFNAWRLNAMHAMSDFVSSQECASRKQLLAARTSKGKTYASFLQTLFDKLEMPVLLRDMEATGIDDTMSPQRPKTSKRRITYEMWGRDEEWVAFRTTPHSGHVPSHIPTLVRDDFLPDSAGKRKRVETTGQDNIGEEEKVDVNDNVTAMSTPVKNRTDRRKWCFRCTYWKRTRDSESNRVQNVSRVEGSKPKKTNRFCMRCKVALCQDCFRPWHEEKVLLPTPTDPGETEVTVEEV
jgi:hypothetical protein